MSAQVVDIFLDECEAMIEHGHQCTGFDLDKLVFDKWIQDKKYNTILWYIEDQYDTGYGTGMDYCLPLLTRAFIEEGEYSRLKRLWESAIYPQLFTVQYIIQELKDFPSSPQYQEHKKQLLDIIEKYLAILTTTPELHEETEHILEIRATIKTDSKLKVSRTTDKRKMNENAFWALIEECRNAENFPANQHLLQCKLESMNKTAIKKTDKIFRQLVANLYSWDLWALAYMLFKGCSDDEFEHFRAGLVMQGKATYSLAVNGDLLELAKQLSMMQTPIATEQSLYIASNAYGKKYGEILPRPNFIQQSITGEEWKEEQLSTRYPEVSRLLAWK